VNHRARWALIALLALVSCGGRSRSSSDYAGGGAAAWEDPDVAGSAPEPQVDDDADAAGESTANQSYSSLIASGTRTCETEQYCFGLSCYAPGSFYPNVCLAPCAGDADCQATEECVRAPRMQPTCYARCKAPVDCYEGFDCYNFSRTGLDLICFPSGWSGRRDELGY
jgi:hypothetical protein